MWQLAEREVTAGLGQQQQQQLSVASRGPDTQDDRHFGAHSPRRPPRHTTSPAVVVASPSLLAVPVRSALMYMCVYVCECVYLREYVVHCCVKRKDS